MGETHYMQQHGVTKVPWSVKDVTCENARAGPPPLTTIISATMVSDTDRWMIMSSFSPTCSFCLKSPQLLTSRYCRRHKQHKPKEGGLVSMAISL